MVEKPIIVVGRATPSGSGPGVAVGDPSVFSGDTFDFTNRFLALVERVLKTDAQLSRFVTTLAQTRQDDSAAPSSTGDSGLLRKRDEAVASAFFHGIYAKSTSLFCLGV